jgi:hypothetical protein
MLKFIQTTILGSWQTTLLGLLLGMSVVIDPIINGGTGQLPTAHQWEMAVLFAIFGLVSKDHNKVGTGATDDPIRSTEAKPDDHNLVSLK